MNALLFDHVWQSTVVLAVIGLLTLFFRNNGAPVRHALWTAASLKFLLPFTLLNMLGHHFSTWLAARPVSPPMVQAVYAASQPFSDGPVFAAMPAPERYLLPMLLVWGAGMLVMSALWVLRWRKLGAALRTTRDAGIGAPMPVKFSATLLEPGLVGIFRPVLLLPEGIADKLLPSELQAIIAHEACHLRRRDNLTAALHMLVETIFWFWPPVWWLGTRLIAEREKACDEAVVASGNDPQVYAESILKVCKHYVSSPLACAAGVSGADLKQRMENIMKNNAISRLNIPRKALLAASAAAVLALPLAAGVFTSPPALAQANAPHPGTEAVLRRIIAGALSGKPDVAEMRGQLADVTNQHDMLQISAKNWGAFKSLTFKGNEGANDSYAAEFEKAYIAFTIGPVVDGKIETLFFGPAIRRSDNSPSPGLAAAIRRLLEGELSGTPAIDVMSPSLQQAEAQQRDMISADSKRLGAIRSIDFQKVNARGWDVYSVTYANGTSITEAAPLTDGKLAGILTHDILLPKAPPHPGTEASLRRYIVSLQKGAPNYEEMVPRMADAVRQQLPQIQPMVKSWGALKSIAFVGGGPGGMDIYDVTFEHGKAQWSVGALTADGKVDRRGFRPIP